jgi:hypothetical protein
MKKHNIDGYFISPDDILNERKVEKILKLIPSFAKSLKILRRKVIKESKTHLKEITSLMMNNLHY